MFIKEFLDMVKNVALGVIIALLIIKFVGNTAIVSQVSMQPTLVEGDVLWVEKITPNFGNLKRGDIITIYAPKVIPGEGHTLVKRIVALENDHILFKNGKVYVNGFALKEDYILGNNTTAPSNPSYNNIIIQPGYLYALGDNRVANIWDSRNMGQISKHEITGRVIFRFYPLKKLGSMIKE
jgi:signal peptidase I